MWDLIVLVPNHCLSFYITVKLVVHDSNISQGYLRVKAGKY